MNMKKQVLLFTGDGKGKTTAALGMVLRAVGHKMKVCVIQFVKSWDNTGEVAALSTLPGVTLYICGAGYVRNHPDADNTRHRKAAARGLSLAWDAVCEGHYDMVVLDEICGALQAGLVAEEDLLTLIDDSRNNCIMVLTGRNASAQLIERADTVTSMQKIRHGYDKGLTARPGIEW